jgi:hypothetical protein
MLFQPAIIVRFRLSFKCETISYRKLVVCRYPPSAAKGRDTWADFVQPGADGEAIRWDGTSLSQPLRMSYNFLGYRLSGAGTSERALTCGSARRGLSGSRIRRGSWFVPLRCKRSYEF